MSVGAVVSYCSLDKDFLDPCIEQLSKFCSEISISYSDSLFNGEPEDPEHLKALGRFPAYLCPFKFEPEKGPHWNHNRARVVGYSALSKDVDWVLFVDADEVPNGQEMADWLKPNRIHFAYRFQCYWYFRSPEFQSVTVEDAATLVRASLLSERLLQDTPRERVGLLESFGGQSMVPGVDGPMWHHYSWARSKQAMLKKIQGWGHKGDTNWQEKIEQEFKREFDETMRDFVHGYSYRRVDPFVRFRIPPEENL